MEIIVNITPKTINGVGISLYNITPKTNAEMGSAPAVNMAALLTSTYFRDSTSKAYGSINDSRALAIKNRVFMGISILINVVIWLKLVNGIKITVIVMMI